MANVGLIGGIGQGLSAFNESFQNARAIKNQRDMQQALQDRQAKMDEMAMAQRGEDVAFRQAQAESAAARAAKDDELAAQRFEHQKQKDAQELALKRAEIGAKKGNPLLDKEFELAQKYSGDPQAKRAAEMGEAVNKIVQSAQAKNAAADMSLIYSFMKLNDPGSTVREGEFATAQNASGVPEQVRNAYNKAMKGEKLGDKQRVQFANQGIGLFESQIKSMQPINEQYGAFAKEYGVRPERVIRNYQAPGRLAEPVEQEAPGLLSRVSGFLRGGQAQSPAAPQTKSIGGKTYIKVDGGWQEQ